MTGKMLPHRWGSARALHSLLVLRQIWINPAPKLLGGCGPGVENGSWLTPARTNPAFPPSSPS